MSNRVRIERRDDHRAPLVRSALHGPADDRLVTEMKAVEIAKRDDRALKLLGECLVVEQAHHPASFCASSGIGTRPARITRSALPPMTARTWSSVNPSSSSAWVTCASCDTSKRGVGDPSE